MLISPLKLQVTDSPQQGRVQAIVRDTVKKKYVSRVAVRVIGSANKDFVSGKTDLRGVFVASEIRGVPTVIVQLNKNQYAFYRGKQPTIRPYGNQVARRGKGGKGKGRNVLLDGVLDGQKKLQSKQINVLDSLYRGLRNVDGTMSKGGGIGGFGGGGFGGGGLF